MRAAGRGDPACPYALAVLGSAGRGESLLAMDQDNALVFAEGAPDGPQDRWFEATRRAHRRYPARGGRALLPGRRHGEEPAMARLARHLAGADRRLDSAISSAGPLVRRYLLRHASRARRRSRFARSSGAAPSTPPAATSALPSSWPRPPARWRRGLGLFGRFKTRQGRIDLKKAGLFGIVTAARVLAIRHHVVERSTPARLAGIKALGLGAASDLDALIEAQATFLDLSARTADRGHRKRHARRPMRSRSSDCPRATATGCVSRWKR